MPARHPLTPHPLRCNLPGEGLFKADEPRAAAAPEETMILLFGGVGAFIEYDPPTTTGTDVSTGGSVQVVLVGSYRRETYQKCGGGRRIIRKKPTT